MDQSPAELSIVMPAYNEEVAIAAAVEDIISHVVPHVRSAEIVVVNDGSKDRTLAILKDIASHEPRLTLIDRPNGGHGPALITGLNAASGESLLLLDSDRQIALENFAAAWSAYRAGDALIGIRADRRDGLVRAIISRSMRAVLGVLFGKVPRDPNIPFKIVRRADWARAASAIGPDNPLPSVLLALHLVKSGARIVQHPITHRAREGSVSELRGWKLFKFCLLAGRTLLAFRLNPEVRALRARQA
jgi:dolichol-phosphate mannosyltransferase